MLSRILVIYLMPEYPGFVLFIMPMVGGKPVNHPFTIHIRERREYDPLEITDKAYVDSHPNTLYPEQSAIFRCSNTKSLDPVPMGYHYYGAIMCNIGDGIINIPVEY